MTKYYILANKYNMIFLIKFMYKYGTLKGDIMNLGVQIYPKHIVTND